MPETNEKPKVEDAYRSEEPKPIPVEDVLEDKSKGEKTGDGGKDDTGGDDGLSEDILQRLDDYGLDESWAEKFPDDESLAAALDVIDEQAVVPFDDYVEDEDDEVASSSRKRRRKPEPQVDEEDDLEYEPISLDLSDGDWDDETKKTLNSLVDKINKQGEKRAKALQKIRDKAEQQAIHAELKERHSWLDDRFNSLDDDYKAAFGKGTVHDLKPRSKAMRNRREVDRVLWALQDTNPGASREALFRRALGVVTGGRSGGKTLTKKQLRNLEKRSGQTIGRPTRKRSEDIQGKSDRFPMDKSAERELKATFRDLESQNE
jgi:hypothetical protein